MDFKLKLHNYVKAVQSGEWVAGKYQQLAVDRFVNDLKRTDLKFNIEEGERWCKFFSLLKHSKGKQHLNKPFILEGWQVFLIMNIYGWQKLDGLRRFKNVYIEIARKNGKSTLVTGMGLGALLIDREATPEVYSAATKGDQARIVFEEAGRMVNKSDLLSNKLTVMRDSIFCKSNFGVFKPLASDSKTLDGLNVHFAAIDEVHAHKSSEVIDLLDTATGAREQPLIVEITTSGSNKGSICYKHHEMTKKVLEGVIKNDAWFGVVYSIDEGDDWKDEKVWIKANPNLAVSKRKEYMAEQYEKAIQMPSFLNTFLRLDLNVWTGSTTRWISDETWMGCYEQFSEQDLLGMECIAGCDLASVGDTNAISLLFKTEDGYKVLNYFFVPAETKQKKYELDNINYPEWVREGDIIETTLPSRDDEAIVLKILEIKSKFKLKAIAFDRWQSEDIVHKLESVGVECVAFGQGYRSMSYPTKKLEEMVTNRQLKHNGNKAMRWMVSNIMIERDAADNIKINKAKSSEKVDGPVSLVMALGTMLDYERKNINSNYVW
jgi:phage terminase large subunit-like protein